MENGFAAGNSALQGCKGCECWGCGVLLVEVREGDSIRYGESEPGVRESLRPGCELMVNEREVGSTCELECTGNEL